MYNKKRSIHFVGIGGSGMSGISELLLNLGNTVSGSDIAVSEVTQRLESLGARISIGHDERNISGAEVIVISSAVNSENVEVLAAEKSGVPVIQRAEMLAELMRLKTGIAVAGSHGKTTTTSMIGAVLTSGGVDPTIVVGGKLKSLGTGAKLGRGEFIVAEADESDGSFLRLSPAIAVVTNVDEEHLDFYHNMDGVQETFLKFINHLPFYGAAVVCVDDKNSRELLSKFAKRAITYGFSKDAHVRAENIRHFGGKAYFDVVHREEPVGDIEIGVSGRHNILNALAGIAVGLELELSFFDIREGLRSFEGVQRRFQ
ncbi:MAG: UDP-N-acetylmuramate--L-alanine ligase, partial [Nitrospinota bacterium]